MTAQTDIAKIRSIANEARCGFMSNTIRLDQRQLFVQLETLGEERMEDESTHGKEVTQRLMNFVEAVGRFKFPNSWDDAVRAHFVGEV